MFDHAHYVPILRWKQAERLALRNLRPKDRGRMTPLVEITPRSVAPRKKRPTTEQMLQKNVEDMQKSWGSASLFVDLSNLEQLRDCSGVHPFVYLAGKARDSNVSLIPVTGLRRAGAYDSAVASIVADDARGVCVRLSSPELNRPDLRQALTTLLTRLNVNRREVNLVVDCQYIQGLNPNLDRLIASLPWLEEWKTLTIASGAFPRNLTGFRIGQHCLARSDWQGWSALVNSDLRLRRRPTYGDYTIQHAIYSEPPARANFSASIRYTAESYWVIMRGEGVFHDGSPGFPQWPANAQLLCARPEFCGRDFSYGDRYIWQMAQQTDDTGGAETWLRAGINHHLVFVVRQIATLFET